MKAATAYKKGNALYLQSLSRTTAGVWIATVPFVKVEMGSTPSAKGETVIKLLNASQDGAPHPTHWSGLIAPLLELAGVKSWASFMKNAISLNLEAEGERLTIIPSRNLGSKEGFEPVPENAIMVPFSSPPDQIGEALDKALASCQ
jgi:hypothetical protein